MKEIIGTGKTIDDATEDALRQLGANREEIELEPLHPGTKGFLGMGRKMAQVRATIRDDEKIQATILVRNILNHMNLTSEIDVKEIDGELHIILDDGASTLIGHRGQTLDALQYYIARYLNDEKEDWSKVVVDIDNYREKREEELRTMAVSMAEKVIKSKRDQKTEPLTAPERRIIHMVLKENTGVATFSIGNGNRKRVVIAIPKKGGDRRRRGGGGRGGSRNTNRSGGQQRNDNRGQRGESKGGQRSGGGGRGRPRNQRSSRKPSS
jgi:spoIIIJ-associated protein